MGSHKAPHHAHRRLPRSLVGLMGLYAVALVLVLLVFLGISTWLRNTDRENLVIPDEKAAAASLLATQFSGPRYFQVPSGDMRDATGVVVQATTEPHITTEVARGQVERIVKERDRTADQKARLNELIDRLTEQPSSRLVGAEHINLLRLNLALDALH